MVQGGCGSCLQPSFMPGLSRRGRRSYNNRCTCRSGSHPRTSLDSNKLPVGAAPRRDGFGCFNLFLDRAGVGAPITVGRVKEQSDVPDSVLNKVVSRVRYALPSLQKVLHTHLKQDRPYREVLASLGQWCSGYHRSGSGGGPTVRAVPRIKLRAACGRPLLASWEALINAKTQCRVRYAHRKNMQAVDPWCA